MEHDEVPPIHQAKRTRARNIHRDRKGPLEFINSWSDKLFYRQFRMDRTDFQALKTKLIDNYPGSNGATGRVYYELAEEMGTRSSGSCISMDIKLYVSLRLLAGASYLDMIWYQVAVDSVTPIFLQILNLINNSVDNIKLPATAEEWVQIRQEWEAISIAKRGFVQLPGTALVGDGIVYQTTAFPDKDRQGLPSSIFFNRKGYHGLIAQGFCDAHARFRFFQVNWPGGTNDITAYRQSLLYLLYLRGSIIPLNCFFWSRRGLLFYRRRSTLNPLLKSSIAACSTIKCSLILSNEGI